jgi:protein ImuB
MLFASIFVPDFVVQASLRSEPEEQRRTWSDRPVAVLDGRESLPRVFAANEKAQHVGIAPGITKAQAGQCPGIILRKRTPKQEEAAQDALIDCALGFSPRVESTAPGVVILDIEGTERIFGPAEKLLCALAERAAGVGLTVNAAAAINGDAAHLAAKGFAGITVVAKGREADCLARLPIEVLPLNVDQIEVLTAWGIHRCEDLASLPTVPLIERLGQAGLQLQMLARGESARLLVPVEPPLKFEESLELDDPIEDLEALGFVLNQLLEPIGARLVLRALATDQLTLRFRLDIHQDRDVRNDPIANDQIAQATDVWTRTLNLPVAMQDTKVLLKLLQLDLAQRGPNAAVKAVAIEAHPARRRAGQAGLFAPTAPEPEKLEVTLARIRGMVHEEDAQGRGKVGAPEVPRSHKPDDFQMTVFTSDEKKQETPRDDASRSSRPKSMFRPPLPAHVCCHAGIPVRISYEEVSGAIVRASGPWVTSGHWWKNDEWRRAEWDVTVQFSNGVSQYRIFEECKKEECNKNEEGRWFVESLYD